MEYDIGTGELDVPSVINIPGRRVLPTSEDGKWHRLPCQKCGSAINFSTDTGHVASWQDRAIRCPYCTFRNVIYHDRYRR
jgi:DNA-directed RNA polymerase subunit RPC12/RpoP